MHTKTGDLCEACTFCGVDWFMSDESFFLLDVFTSQDSCSVQFLPCCCEAEEVFRSDGYEALTGKPLIEVLRELTALDVLKVGEWSSQMICRLEILDPTETEGPKAKSPKGWQTEIFLAVDKHHRHHQAPQGWKFGVAVYNGRIRVGVATVGRPVSRVLDDGSNLEVTRVCTFGPPALRKNAASKLYSAASKRAKALGYRRLLTYTLDGVESGGSLVASGWTQTVKSPGGSWSCKSRPREDKAPTTIKARWEKQLHKKATNNGG